jgi:hypothetical protein
MSLAQYFVTFFIFLHMPNRLRSNVAMVVRNVFLHRILSRHATLCHLRPEIARKTLERLLPGHRNRCFR